MVIYMEKVIEEKLYDMVRHAYTTVPLYIKIAEENRMNKDVFEFEELPVMSKSYFINSGVSTLSSEYIIKYMNKQLLWERTSGSTGKFCEVCWDLVEAKKSLFSLWCYRKKYYHILPTDRLCYFFVSDTLHRTKYETDYILAFSRSCIYDGTLEAVYQSIVEFNPVWMILQPSIAFLLSDLVRQRDFTIPTNLRYIEFTGEFLDEKTRKIVEETFGCVTANQYGTKEVNSIAYECPKGNMHCMSDNVYVEVEGSAGESGSICVTSLQNRAMPYIRFNTGDRGRIVSNVKCGCGNCNSILQLEAGRSDDWIKKEDGSLIHAYAVIQLIHAINYEIDGEILQFQIIQKKLQEFMVKLVIDSLEYRFEIAEMIKSCFYDRLGSNVEVIINVYKELLPDESTGKLASFICEV